MVNQDAYWFTEAAKTLVSNVSVSQLRLLESTQRCRTLLLLLFVFYHSGGASAHKHRSMPRPLWIGWEGGGFRNAFLFATVSVSDFRNEWTDKMKTVVTLVSLLVLGWSETLQGAPKLLDPLDTPQEMFAQNKVTHLSCFMALKCRLFRCFLWSRYLSVVTAHLSNKISNNISNRESSPIFLEKHLLVESVCCVFCTVILF